MRIVVIGQAAFGEKILDRLVQNGEDVVGVYTNPDVPSRTNPLKELALKLNIPTFQPPRLRAPEVYTEYIKLKPDLNVMAFVTDIVPESILNHPRYKTIQYHPSLLPKHRGGSSINWAIIKGETKTGISIFWPDKGLDTGPILLQKEVDISPDDTVGSLYFNKLFPLGIDAIMESIALIKENRGPRIPQDESQATYEGLCTAKEAVINWAEPARKVYNLMRGTNPQPGASTCLKGKQFKVFDSRLIPGDSTAAPSQITSITDEGFSVAAAGGLILIKRVQLKGAPKISASDFSESEPLKIGDKLG